MSGRDPHLRGSFLDPTQHDGAGHEPPFSREAEESVIGHLLARPRLVSEVVGTMVQPEHFYVAANRMLFEGIIEAFYADETIDPLTLAEAQAKKLAKVWNTTEGEVVARVTQMAGSYTTSVAGTHVVEHAKLVKQHADYRALLDLSTSVARWVREEDQSAEEIAGILAAQAMKIATDATLSNEIESFADVGRAFVKQMRLEMEAKKQGIELGYKFGLSFIDDFTNGVRATEVMFCGGEPGVGKSAVWWTAARNGAYRQLQVPEDRRMGTLILSLEMSKLLSGIRMAQALTGIDSAKMRTGELTPGELERIIHEWRGLTDIPLYFNFTGSLRASQMKAIISEAIRKHNIGLVVIDHFRYFKMDRRYDNRNDEDDEKVRFLKEGIAKDLNVGVICLAHTRKPSERNQGRPILADLRGSGQISADADFVNFVYSPWQYATDKEKQENQVFRTDAELIWAKNRSGLSHKTAEFYFDPPRMMIRD